MEQPDDLKKELMIALFSMENALSQAILNHYCKSMATLTGKSEDEIRDEIRQEKLLLISKQSLPLE